jgi:DNA-binding NarL/FixJ family response regulator
MFRQGLARLLTSYGGLEVIGETTNDEEAVALAREKKPEVVIMQVQIPFERARRSLDAMRAVEPPPRVIILTMYSHPWAPGSCPRSSLRRRRRGAAQ